MLKQRLITAAVLIPLVVLGILMLPTEKLNWAVALVSGLAAWEWLVMVGVEDINRRLLWVSGLFVLSTVTLSSLPLGPILASAAIVWLIATSLVIKYRHSGLPKSLSALFASQPFGITSCVILLMFFWVAVVVLHQSSLGPQQLLYVLVSVWLADTGGYFAGKKWGTTALAKAISPNKTWQGVMGALALTSVWAILAYAMSINGELSFFVWLLLTLITVAISIIGDLFESLFKRSHQIKDSGNLLPGHGGILDRIDSLISAVPVFVVGLMLLGAL